jgi:hypothetical protein
MARRAVRGTTVVEALIVLLIGSTIIIIILGLLNFATRSFGRTQQRLDPRETASNVVMQLRHHLRDAQFYKIKDEGLTLLYKAPYEFGRMQFDAKSKTIVDTSVQPPKAPEQIGTGVIDFSIHQVRPGLMRLTLVIERPPVQDGLPPLEAMRLVEEIHCPVASRMRMIPWNRTEEHRRRGGRRPQPDEAGTPRAVVAPTEDPSAPSVLDSFKYWLVQ